MNHPDFMKINQRTARILREGLAKIANLRAGEVSRYAVDVLRTYALAVKNECHCIDRVLVLSENKQACLDCGRRYEPS